MEKIAVKVLEPRDIGRALHNVARDPQRFAEGVDTLVDRVSPRIEDAATRQNFEAKMAQLQDRVLPPPFAGGALPGAPLAPHCGT